MKTRRQRKKKKELEEMLPLLSSDNCHNGSCAWFDVYESKLWTTFNHIAVWSPVQVFPCSHTTLIQLSLAVSTLIFILKLHFIITLHCVHFHCTFQHLAAFLKLYLSTCYLFYCWNVLLVYFSWSPQTHLLIYIYWFILSYLISCLLRYGLFQWGCEWCK